MAPFRLRTILAVAGLAGAMGCLKTFDLTRYPNNPALFTAGVSELRAGKWDNAVLIFEKLTLELPARDTLLPLSQFHLAEAYSGRNEHLLAAQSYSRLAESFATDSLADDALYRAGREYQAMWRSPMLDATYGGEAASTYELLLGLYPDSDWKDSAMVQLAALQEEFATKDYRNGMFYMRRKAYDSAIIYFRDVVDKFPATGRSRDALLRLAEAYDAIRYRDDKADVCRTLKEKYPTDPEVAQTCGPVAATPSPPPR